MKFVRLGASLYVPATRDNLVDIAAGRKYPDLRSVIFCTEDAILETGLDAALANIRRALAEIEPSSMLRFVRVRGPEVLARLLDMKDIEKLDGFVLPKITERNLKSYVVRLGRGHPFDVMVTLETKEAFDPGEMSALRDALCSDALRDRLLSIRIGGNDLLNLLGVRRDPRRTIYETALGHTIAQIACTFKPYGINLTGPVNDCLVNAQVLADEVDLDLQHGLFGKTAIHPQQVTVIEARYRVAPADLEQARSILDGDAPAVFRMQDRMCEPATHRGWAEIIAARARIYGVTA